MRRFALVPVLLALVLLAPSAAAQGDAPGEVHLRRLLTTPIGALPPMGMLMPASRDQNYWVGRLQGGTQWDNVAGDLAALAGGIDFQWRGGSTFGLTAGWQMEDCEREISGCASHALFGARARFNVITGGPTVAALVGDNSATTTVGVETGFGYAPNAIAARNACSADVGMPVSVSLFQRLRLLSFFTPGIAWDVRCAVDGSPAVGASTFIGAGLGLQQLGHPGLDVSIGAQRIFRQGSGLQIGVNVTFVRLP
jgi:hypothetical protein